MQKIDRAARHGAEPSFPYAVDWIFDAEFSRQPKVKLLASAKPKRVYRQIGKGIARVSRSSSQYRSQYVSLHYRPEIKGSPEHTLFCHARK